MGVVGLQDCHLFRVSFALVAPYVRTGSPSSLAYSLVKEAMVYTCIEKERVVGLAQVEHGGR